ncbi:RluA family pseudouridine synthase [Mariprofundus ferrooxydans]|uniref:RNA pseudouridine synthase family protein n=1 Tax=Mariprofundus ferrooxydans PV-1 TaxID=314345 RepID=Q0F2T6_9PROT|nr:RluA family pseudouridine synthase [Mariprofundus ferrooxydans]EAU56205.1 RNA pseudouridine synthase family protein [Mariprofundus ferrooxydans PV-1]KON48035.1 pseudouridine synthase [Mariprofundus ferrooxydans]
MSKPGEFIDLKGRVTTALAGQRLDQGLAEVFTLSRRRSRRAIDEGGVYLNGKRCRTAGRKLSCHDNIRVVMLEGERLIPFTPAQLVWQQPPLYLIHKKSGQYAQEALHRSRGTLPDELARHLELTPAQASELRPVHRLDRDTSGLMLFSASAAMLQHLQAHWHDAVEKRYLAVVSPAPDWDDQRIRLAIDRNRDAHGRYHLSPDGRACDSEAHVVERRDNRALVELVPHTGRSHQLRVHLSALGCPILGDSRYGGKPHPRLMLHAVSLCIRPPALPETKQWNQPPEENWQW